MVRRMPSLICEIVVVDAKEVIFYRELARRVEKIDDAFFVPSNRSDYEVLQRIQSETKARQAQTSFIAAKPSRSNPYDIGRIKVLLPSAAQTKLVSWADVLSTKINSQHWWHHRQILVDPVKSPGQTIFNLTSISHADFVITAVCKLKFPNKRKMVVSPGAALTASRLPFPFFIIEVAIMQTRKEVLERVQPYVEGSGGHLKILAVLELHRTPNGEYRVLLSIWRIGKHPDQTTDDSRGFGITENALWSAVEVYPQQAEGYLRIWMKDVMTSEDAVGADDTSVDIELRTLHVPARIAVEFQLRDDDRNE